MRGAVTGSTSRLLVAGAIFWALGVASVRFMGPLGAFRPALALLLVTVPVVWTTVRVVAGAMPRSVSLLESVSLVCMPALLLDGIAFSLVPGLYGSNEAERRTALAWLVFYVAMCLATAAFGAGFRKGRGLGNGTSPN